MIRNKDFAMLYAGRAVFNKNGYYAGVVVGWNDMLGVILGVDHGDSWHTWILTDIRVSEDEFPSYEYRNAGTLEEPGELIAEEAPKHKTIGELIKEHEGVRGIQFSTDEHGNVQAVYIRGKHGGIYWRKEDFIKWHLNKNREMIKEPRLPHKLKWGDRTAAKVDEVEYLIGIRVVGYTSLKDVIIAEVHESVAYEVGAWSLPPEDLKSVSNGDVFMEKPRAGAYYKYIKIKNIVHEES